jgi:hypothetical protein
MNPADPAQNFLKKCCYSIDLPTKSPGRHVGSDKDERLAGAELPEDPVPLLLPLVAVDAHGGVAVPSHDPRQIVALPLRLREDDDLGGGVARHLLQQFGQLVLLLPLLMLRNKGQNFITLLLTDNCTYSNATKKSRDADLHHFNADTDPAFHFEGGSRS